METSQLHLYRRRRLRASSPRRTAISPTPSPGSSPRPTRRACALVLYVTIEMLRIVAILLQPVMPGAWASCSTCSAVAAGRARTSRARRRARRPCGSTRRIGCEPGAALAPPSADLPRYVEPTRREAGNARDTHRQPLPSRLSRLRRRLDAVVGARARPGVERMMTIGTRVDRRDGSPRSPSATTTSSSPSARIRMRPRARRASDFAADARRWRRIRNASASARRASTITMTTRRRDVARRVFRGHIALARELEPAARHPYARRRRRHRRDPEGGDGAGALSRPCCTASPPRARSPRRRSTSASTSRFPACVTFKKSDDLARHRRATCRSTGCWSRPTRLISRRPVSRQAQRAGLCRRNRARRSPRRKGMAPEALAAATRANTLRLFSKIAADGAGA